ncbi:MAG: tRNA pseudouridine(38-40) synthase TruA [Hungatella sp.]|nr:tRNA pseudouridine(38-40) synthase TruA [Hungatella sp.]
MKRIKMVLAYDGTNYCGWQLQTNGVTIEEVLNKALSELLREPIAVIGASRTDSGVHAEGNVAVFDTENRMPADKICFALNQRLPEDIRVQSSEEVAPDWHPRKQNCVKTYEYRILNRKVDMPTMRLYSYFSYFPLNVERMRRAASFLVGEHDFKSFCTVRGQAEDTVRTIYRLDVIGEKNRITIRVSGSGFLYNMVRIIAGTLMKVGMGVYPPEHVKEILRARNRQAAGPTAPAKGLTLMGMEYETELKKKIVGKNEDWEYQLIQTEIPEKKKAYLFINRCAEEDFDRLLTRVTHQAVRNGARQVYVCDREGEGRIVPGKAYGYYLFRRAHNMLEMKKTVSRNENDGREVEWERVSPWQVSSLCTMYNTIFYEVPNSATLTEEEIRQWMSNSRWHLYFVRSQGQIAGFLMLIEKEQEVEIDSLGILEEYRGRGLAKQMLWQLENRAAQRGFQILSLGVSSINTAAWSLYKGLGFSEEKVTSRWYVTEDQSDPGQQTKREEKGR